MPIAGRGAASHHGTRQAVPKSYSLKRDTGRTGSLRNSVSLARSNSERQHLEQQIEQLQFSLNEGEEILRQDAVEKFIKRRRGGEAVYEWEERTLILTNSRVVLRLGKVTTRVELNIAF